jgi:general secretion pathway protein K
MMMKPPRSNFTTERTAADGFIVVVVLWLLGALSMLASIYSVFVVNTATGFTVYDDQLRSEALVSAALELTAHQHLTQQPSPTSGKLSFHFGQANIAVKFQPETARIDLNAAPKQLLAGLFRTLGARPIDADIYADRVVAWRTAQPDGQDSEASAYRMARLGYQPRGAKFPHINELALVRDLPTPLVERALPFVTVYSGRAQVNVLDAASEVVAALPGMTLDRVNTFLAARLASPENVKTLLPNEAQQYATIEGSKAVRVFVRLVFDNGHQENAEVVILIVEDGEKPFAILSWRDDRNAMIPDSRQ